jgi:hypothetical protein
MNEAIFFILWIFICSLTIGAPANVISNCPLSKFCNRNGTYQNFTTLQELELSATSSLKYTNSCYAHFTALGSLVINANLYKGPISDQLSDQRSADLACYLRHNLIF